MQFTESADRWPDSVFLRELLALILRLHFCVKCARKGCIHASAGPGTIT
jgi:hypothetical protein